MKADGRVQPLRADIYYYCSDSKRERDVSLLLSDKEWEKGSFPSDAGGKKKPEKLMLSADLIFYTSLFSGVSREKKRSFEKIFEDYILPSDSFDLKRVPKLSLRRGYCVTPNQRTPIEMVWVGPSIIGGSNWVGPVGSHCRRDKSRQKSKVKALCGRALGNNTGY